jgi:hypothetical protein
MVLDKSVNPDDSSECITWVSRQLSKHISQDNMLIVTDRLKMQAQNTHPFYLEIANNFKSHWHEVLVKSSQNPGTSVSATCLQVPELAARIVGITEKNAMNLARISILHKKVHARFYEPMIAQAMVVASA